MVDYTDCYVERVSVHNVGNKTNGEDLRLSKNLLDTSDLKVQELLLKFFLTPFNTPEFYSFTFTNEDFNLNPVYNFATDIFDNLKSFHKNSVNLAKHLFELSIHPQIKPGDLFVAYFTGVAIEGGTTDAVGIFKSENRQAFLKLNSGDEDFSIHYEDGINIEKLDKGCLIINTDADSGYKVCIVDKSNKSIEAQYWKDTFLQLKPCSDDYHHTKEFLNIAKNFVTKQISEEFEVTKADKIDLLNRSVDYFKTHETFDKNDFEQQVFKDNTLINSFRNYDESYRENHELDVVESFEISAQAVKKQARIFKSVLKLDKNFHIYIHGDRELIEQGVDADGRKFYKIYYREEN
ncbi:MAG: nucleoid-associated protein [Bacteroidota bacterium]